MGRRGDPGADAGSHAGGTESHSEADAISDARNSPGQRQWIEQRSVVALLPAKAHQAVALATV
jgi:hypothetical protein